MGDEKQREERYATKWSSCFDILFPVSCVL